MKLILLVLFLIGLYISTDGEALVMDMVVRGIAGAARAPMT